MWVDLLERRALNKINVWPLKKSYLLQALYAKPTRKRTYPIRTDQHSEDTEPDGKSEVSWWD